MSALDTFQAHFRLGEMEECSLVTQREKTVARWKSTVPRQYRCHNTVTVWRNISRTTAKIHNITVVRTFHVIVCVAYGFWTLFVATLTTSCVCISQQHQVTNLPFVFIQLWLKWDCWWVSRLTFVTYTSTHTPFPNRAVNLQRDASEGSPHRHSFTTVSNQVGTIYKLTLQAASTSHWRREHLAS